MDLMRGAARRAQAELLRLLVRHVPRARRTRACSRRATGRWCSTARSTRRRTSTSRWRDLARADGRASSARSAASSRPARADQAACAGFGGERSVGRVRRSWSTQAERAPIPAPATRPTRGRWTATTSTSRPPNELYAKELWARARRGARRRRRPATARSSATLVGRLLRPQRRRDVRPGLDRYFTIGATEQRYPRDVDFYLEARRRGVGPVRPRLLEQRLHRAELRAVADRATATRSTGRSGSRARRRRRSSSRRRTTRRRPYRGALRLVYDSSATRG